jgi:hypothetical protein
MYVPLLMDSFLYKSHSALTYLEWHADYIQYYFILTITRLKYQHNPELPVTTITSARTMTAGRVLFSLVAFVTSFGCYFADWNETHIKNPNWPPHARFHNGQTMSMGMGLGLLTLYITWRAGTTKSTPEQSLDSAFLAALTGSMYWLTGMSAILYPGARWVDPEYDDGKLAPQIIVFSTMFVLSWVAYLLERQRLSPAVEAYKRKGQ